MAAWRFCLFLPLTAAAGVWLAGCNPPASSQGSGSGGEAHEHEHAHHGPHGGHLMEIGEEEYHAEWTHEESGKVAFYILDAEAKKEVPIAAEEIAMEVKIGKNEPTTFKLAAVNPQDGKAAAFELVDNNLLGVLETLKSPGVVATLHVNIDDKAFVQRIQEHEHGH